MILSNIGKVGAQLSLGLIVKTQPEGERQAIQGTTRMSGNAADARAVVPEPGA
jgi:hypothetical protein